MPIPTAYLTTNKHLTAILGAVQRAGVPSRFTFDFLKQLGYPSSSDRPVIAVMKALRFLTDAGEPTERYRRFKDDKQARVVMAEAIREAYADVFVIDQQAHTRTAGELRGIFARLSDKGDAVNVKMATTFKGLADLADFQTSPIIIKPIEEKAREVPVPPDTVDPKRSADGAIVLHHDVHIHLPESTNIAVYDAIFRSLREHLK